MVDPGTFNHVPLEGILVCTQSSRPHDPHSWWGAERRAFPVRSEGPKTVKSENPPCAMKTLTWKLASSRKGYGFCFFTRSATAFTCSPHFVTQRETILSSHQVAVSFRIVFPLFWPSHHTATAELRPNSRLKHRTQLGGNCHGIAFGLSVEMNLSERSWRSWGIVWECLGMYLQRSCEGGKIRPLGCHGN